MALRERDDHALRRHPSAISAAPATPAETVEISGRRGDAVGCGGSFATTPPSKPGLGARPAARGGPVPLRPRHQPGDLAAALAWSIPRRRREEGGLSR